MLKIRPVTLADAPELVRIYAPYVDDTAITFEYNVPTTEEFERRIEKTLKRFPYLVAEENGQVLAYAYASTYYDRSAYDWAVEVSVYVDEHYLGQGLGSRLYETLERELEARGYLRFLASCIALPCQIQRALPCMKSGAMFKSLISQRLGISSTNGMILSGCKRRLKGL